MPHNELALVSGVGILASSEQLSLASLAGQVKGCEGTQDNNKNQ